MGIEADRRGVSIWVAGDNRDAESIAPALELLDRSGAKCIGSGEQHRVSARLEPVSELGRRGGFTSAVHADDEDHERFAIGPRCGCREIIGQHFHEMAAGGANDIIGGNFATEIAEFVDDFCARVDAEVGTDQIGLEFVPIDFRAVGDLVEEGFKKTCHMLAGRELRVNRAMRGVQNVRQTGVIADLIFARGFLFLLLSGAEDPRAFRHFGQPGRGG